MLICVNRAAHGGQGLERWKAIERAVLRETGPAVIIVTDDADSAERNIARFLAAGERDFIAAGGDGTVRALVQSILDKIDGEDRPGRNRRIEDVRISAIGLGSSNDFHKPARGAVTIGGRPCRIVRIGVEPRDVGVVEYLDPSTGATRRRYWLLNASIGLTAEANRIFNQPGQVLKILKRASTSSAIAGAALRALAANRPQALSIEDGARGFTDPDVVNLAVVISPHFTGALRYDSPFDPRSGAFTIHLCRETTLRGKLRTLVDLARGRFTGRGHTRSWRADRLTVRSDVPFPVEFDGEVAETSRVSFSIRPGVLRFCR